MGFDTKAFMAAKFEDRTKTVPVPDLKKFFGEGEPPVWTVRQLGGFEIGQAKMARTKARNRDALLSAMQDDSALSAEVGEVIKQLAGIGRKHKAGDVIERIEYLIIGSVEPVCDLELALKVCKVNGTLFYQLTNEIMTLSGLGMQEAKPSGSTETAGSSSPCGNATDEVGS